MKKLLYILFLITSISFSQETVEIIAMNQFADHTASIKGAFKIVRHTALETTLDVTYTVTGGGASYVDVSSGTVTIAANSQSELIEFTTTSNPVSDETLTVTVTDVSNPDYDLGTRTSVNFTITNSTPTPAFPNAEGAAKYIGSEISDNTWRGGSVYFVDNLNASGAGSFVQALQDANSAGSGYIVFRVGGNIALTTRLNMSNYNGIYIAGQTAPGDGIYLSGYSSTNGIATISDGDNILIRFIDFDHGNKLTGGAIDAFGIFNSTDLYINHCSIIRGDDEIISAVNTDYTKLHGRITLDWSFIGEGYYIYSPFENHNTASIMGGLGSADVKRQLPLMTFSWNKNLTYNVSHRFPNASGYGHFESVNNVIANHDYRLMQISYPQPKVNWVGNYIQAGNHTNNIGDAPFSASQYFEAGNKFSRISSTFDDAQMGLMYADGNVLNGYISESDDDWWFNTYFFDVAYLDNPFPKTNQLLTPVDIYGSTEILTAASAFTVVTGAGGAGNSIRLEGDGTVTNRRNAFYQSRFDEVIADNVSTYIDAGNWSGDKPSFATNNSPYADTDNDGMGDAWEIANGLNTEVDDHSGHDLHPIYDNIEVFLNIVDQGTATNIEHTLTQKNKASGHRSIKKLIRIGF